MIDFESNQHWPPSTTATTPPSPPNEEQPSIPSDVLMSLRQHSLFQRTNNDLFLSQLVSLMSVRQYNPRDIIITQGEPSKAMFFLLRGKVEVCSADNERIYATLEAGSCFGEIGILYSRPRTATVVAVVKSTVAALTAHQVHTLLPQFPKVDKIIRYEAQERLALLAKTPSISSDQSCLRYNVEAFSKTGIRNYLTRIPFFFGCSEDFLHLIGLSVQPRTYDPNTILIEQGEHGDTMYFIVEGTVDIKKQDTCSERLGPGGYFGDSAVLLDRPYAATVQTVTQVEVYLLNRTNLQQVCDLFPDTGARLWRMAHDKLHKVPKQGPSLTIPPQSICRTTCDNDPMTPATQLRQTETRRRRASVAVWNDPVLSELARKTTQVQQQPGIKKERPMEEETRIESEIHHPTLQSDRFTMTFHSQLLTHVLLFLDYKTALQLMRLNRTLHHLFTANSLPRHVDLSTLHKKITDETLTDQLLPRIRPHTLSLAQCFHLTHQGFQALAQSDPTDLIDLDLNSCWLLTDASLQQIGDHCPNLQRVDLSNCRKITNTGLIQFLQTQPNLAWLSLSYCKNLTNLIMAHLPLHLSYLNLQRCTKITDEGFTTFLSDLTQLRDLVLVDCSFLTDRAIERLVQVTSHSLHSLNLSFCCALSDSVMPLIAQLEHLQHLDLSFCGAAVSDTSLLSLANAPALTRLNLRGCVRVSGQGLIAFLDRHPLVSLNISQCPLVSMDVKKKLITDRRWVKHLSI